LTTRIFSFVALFVWPTVALSASAADGPAERWSELSDLRQVSGKWTTQDGMWIGAADGGDVFARSEETVTDFVMEADIRLIAGQGAAAVVFRANADLSRLYAVTLDHRLGVLRLFKWPDPVVLKDVPAKLTAGTTHRVRVAGTGARITAELDGQPLIDVTDAAHARGFLGLNVFGFGGPASATFQNVRFQRTKDSIEGQIQQTEEMIANSRELAHKFQEDPQRPRYHFLPPSAWLNDPNGAIYWKGRYHVFYQHNPDGGYWKWMQWGHASSTDLVHWVHHPIALTPTHGGPDREGCFSGGVVVHDGVPTFIYHGVPDGTCLATSTDDLLLRWTKHPENPVITPKKIPGKFQVYDPCAWKQGDSWFALCGRIEHGRDIAYLFRSPDLVRWEYLHPFYESNGRWTDDGEDCAVPDFFPLGGKHVLTFASHARGGQYYIGRYEHDRFLPEQHGRMNWPGGSTIAPITLLDGRDRRVLFVWINEQRTVPRCRASGWAGMLALPRVLSLGTDGQLHIEPVPELNVLRMDCRSQSDRSLTADDDLTLEGIQGDSLEIACTLEPGGAAEVGLRVRCAPDDAEQTTIAFRPGDKTLAIDTRRSTQDPDVGVALTQTFLADKTTRIQVAPLELAAGEPLRLRVFLDRSIIEVYANGRQAVTQRIYPSRPDSLQVRAFSRGGPATLRTLDAWTMAPAGL
jgi:beta-fructofuranosidase